MLQYTHMEILAVTCQSADNIKDIHKAGAEEAVFALKDGCFSALTGFSKEELKELISLTHEEGMRFSVLMNRLFHEDMIKEAQETMMELIHAGADAVLFADLGLMKKAMEEGVTDRMIYQPETLMTSTPEAEVYGALGLQAVMISSLLTEGEIEEIAKAVKQTGVSVHGYQLMSVSARGLLSAYSAVSGRESLKNRNGLYLREEKRNEFMPVYENDYCALIYTDYILESFDQLERFQKAGVQRFQADSWNISPDSLNDALRIYRNILDGKDASSLIQEYRKKYADLPISEGYYSSRTVK